MYEQQKALCIVKTILTFIIATNGRLKCYGTFKKSSSDLCQLSH